MACCCTLTQNLPTSDKSVVSIGCNDGLFVAIEPVFVSVISLRSSASMCTVCSDVSVTGVDTSLVPQDGITHVASVDDDEVGNENVLTLKQLQLYFLSPAAQKQLIFGYDGG
jgi:hypothetical protein